MIWMFHRKFFIRCRVSDIGWQSFRHSKVRRLQEIAKRSSWLKMRWECNTNTFYHPLIYHCVSPHLLTRISTAFSNYPLWQTECQRACLSLGTMTTIARSPALSVYLHADVCEVGPFLGFSGCKQLRSLSLHYVPCHYSWLSQQCAKIQPKMHSK